MFSKHTSRPTGKARRFVITAGELEDLVALSDHEERAKLVDQIKRKGPIR